MYICKQLLFIDRLQWDTIKLTLSELSKDNSRVYKKITTLQYIVRIMHNWLYYKLGRQTENYLTASKYTCAAYYNIYCSVFSIHQMLDGRMQFLTFFSTFAFELCSPVVESNYDKIVNFFSHSCREILFSILWRIFTVRVRYAWGDYILC